MSKVSKAIKNLNKIIKYHSSMPGDDTLNMSEYKSCALGTYVDWKFEDALNGHTFDDYTKHLFGAKFCFAIGTTANKKMGNQFSSLIFWSWWIFTSRKMDC